MNDTQKKLEELRKKRDEIKSKRERLEGEISAKEEQKAQLEKKIKDQFGCDIGDVPDYVESLESKANDALSKASDILEPNKESE